jgi:hypothetical protein
MQAEVERAAVLEIATDCDSAACIAPPVIPTFVANDGVVK